MSERAVNVGIVGLGFMGQTHFRAYESANESGHPCRVVTVCESDPQRRIGKVFTAGNIDSGGSTDERLFDPDNVRAGADLDSLLADDDVELVSICTHTDTHPEFAIRAIEAGKHVLIEKPVATTSDDVARVVSAAKAHPEQIVMPAMCVRFWPGYSWLKDQVSAGAFGRVRSATFHRLGSPPAWAQDFYADVERSGGAIFDLHIHDVDFLRYLFGDPERVSSTGHVNHVTTLYRYGEDGPAHVVCEGGWGHVEGFPFQARFIVTFEKATVDFDTRRGADALIVYRDGESETITIESLTGWEIEIRHMVDLIARRVTQPIARIDEALAVTRILEAERESCQTGQSVSITSS